MAVRAIKSEQRCKLCRSDRREEIDALLELRSEAGKLPEPDGRRATIDVVIEKLAEWGIANPTKENVTTHFKRHCQLVTPETVAAIDSAITEALATLAAGGKIDPDTALDRIVMLGMAEIEAKVANGQLAGIPPDLVLKAIQVKTQRGASEAQSDLLRGLGGGIAAALASGSVRAITPPAAADDVIEDGEFEEVAAGG